MEWLLFSVITLILLIIWQIGSAFQLYYDYNYSQRGRFVKFAGGLCLAIPVLIHLPSIWRYLPFLLLAAGYLWITCYDTLRVYRRHRSFWDLGS